MITLPTGSGAVYSGVGFVKHFALEITSGEDIARKAEDIRDRLSSALRLVDQIVSAPAPIRPVQRITEERLRAALRVRRNRDRYFDSKLFADPAWDILLELYAAELGQRRVAVSSLCIGAAVPATTALRWIKTLEQKGMIQRAADPTDGRRVFVSLAPDTSSAMEQFFSSLPAGTVLS